LQINYEEIRRMADTIREICGDDEDTYLDTLEGETDAMEVMSQLIQQRMYAKAFQQASKEMAAQYTERARRMADKEDAVTQVMGHLLDAIGVKKLQHPLATISRTKPRWSVKVVDEAAIPKQLVTTLVKPDLATIKKQLDQGEFVPGVEIVPGNPGVTMRVK
jgi:hypothetical protein